MFRQQFRRAGLLIWPRSKRLLNAVHGGLGQQTLRLHFMLVGRAEGWGRCLPGVAMRYSMLAGHACSLTPATTVPLCQQSPAGQPGEIAASSPSSGPLRSATQGLREGRESEAFE